MTGSILIGVLTETKCIMKHLFCIIYFVVFFFCFIKNALVSAQNIFCLRPRHLSSIFLSNERYTNNMPFSKRLHFDFELVMTPFLGLRICYANLVLYLFRFYER